MPQLLECKPGKSIRLQMIGNGERLSTVYSFVTAKKTPDLYITPMMLGGRVKVSLHEMGSWQVGLTSEGQARVGKPGVSRHWDIWPRTTAADLSPAVTRAWYLMLPDEQLRAGRGRDPKAIEIPDVGPDHAASVEVLMVAPEGPEIVVDSVCWLARLLLAGRDESALIGARRIPWPPAWRARALARRHEIAAQGAAIGKPPRDDHAYLVHGHNEQGVRFAVELASAVG